MDLEKNLSEFNKMPDTQVHDLLYKCCACDEWCRRVAIRRPYTSFQSLRDVCDDEWWRLTASHWRESFNGHPRIGDKHAVQAKASSNSTSWESDEQKGASTATSDILEAIRIGNIEYEKKFGFIYLICATNKDANALLTTLNDRLTNNNPIDEVI